MGRVSDASASGVPDGTLLPKPFYEDGSVTIYHGDAREILPSLKVDAVITDPPYGMSLNTDNSRFSGGLAPKRGQGPGTGAGRPILSDDEPFDPSFLLGVGQGQIIWGWNHFAGHLPRGHVWSGSSGTTRLLEPSSVTQRWLGLVAGKGCGAVETSRTTQSLENAPTPPRSQLR